jgi:hypothetical protein
MTAGFRLLYADIGCIVKTSDAHLAASFSVGMLTLSANQRRSTSSKERGFMAVPTIATPARTSDAIDLTMLTTSIKAIVTVHDAS